MCDNLVNDCTFFQIKSEKYEFLDNFNLEVKNAIIKKIQADIYLPNKKYDKNIIEKYGEITTLNNLIDIVFFLENTP